MDKHPVFFLPIHARMRASERLGAVYAVACYEAIGLTRTAAVAVVATRYAVSPSALWRWLVFMPHEVSISPNDMLLALADTHASRRANSPEAPAVGVTVSEDVPSGFFDPAAARATRATVARLLAASQKADPACAVFDPNRQQAGWIDPAVASATRAAIKAEHDAGAARSFKRGVVILAVAFALWFAILLLWNAA